MKVEVTQFMRPNGRQVPHQLEVSDKCQEKYDEIVGQGLRLTCEQMMTGQASQTIEAEDFDFDIVITKGSDFDENKAELEKMILRFDKFKYQEQLKQFHEV